MSNDTTEQRRTHAGGGLFALYRGLYVGPLVAFAGGLANDTHLVAVAAWYWIFSYAYCAPWMARLVRRRDPPQDHHLVAAVLALASLPWGLFLLEPETFSRPEVLRWAALAAMAPGVAALLSANLTWPPRAAPWRSLVLVAGGLVYGGWAAGYAWIVAGALAPWDWPPLLGLDSRGFAIAAVFMLPAPFIALWMAVRLIMSPLESVTSTPTDTA